MCKDTDEMLAVKFPNSYHLMYDLEDACTEIKQRGHGWGRIGIDGQGLNTVGQIVVKFFDVQSRRFRQDKKIS